MREREFVPTTFIFAPERANPFASRQLPRLPEPAGREQGRRRLSDSDIESGNSELGDGDGDGDADAESGEWIFDIKTLARA